MANEVNLVERHPDGRDADPDRVMAAFNPQDELRKALRGALEGFEGKILTPELREQAAEAMRAELTKLVHDWRKPTVVATPQPGDTERGILRFEVRPSEK